MLVAILSIVAGLLLLALGAEGLVGGSSSIALRMGIAPLVVGLTIVAFGTGSPEFVVSISAAYSGNSGIALGNVIGSNISNVALILGVAALVRPLTVSAEVLKRELPIMIAVSGFLWLLIYDGTLSRMEGVFLTMSAIAYTFATYWLARNKETPLVEEEFERAIETTGKSPWLDVVLISGGFTLLIVGANVMLYGAVAVARAFGIGEVVIGLSIIAIGTSLPELATSAAAARKNEPDIAFGNAIGSNVLNILAVLGVTAALQPISTEGIRPLDVGVMLGSALVLFVLLGRNYKLSRIEGSMLLSGYGVYLYTLIP